MVMKTSYIPARMVAFAAVLLSSENPSRATEPIHIQSFQCALVVNGTSRPAVARTESGSMTALLEMHQPDGQWCSVARLKAPVATPHLELNAGEAWQFLVPEFGPASPVSVRLAVKVGDGILYSQTFQMNVDDLARNKTIDCWLARLRIRQERSDDSSVIAAAAPKPGS